MRTRALVVAAATAAALLAVAIAALLPAQPDRSLPAPKKTVVVRAAFTPAAVEFGDVITARIVVSLDARAVRPASLRLVYDLAPLTQLGSSVERHTTRGALVVVTRELRAACLADACVSSAGPRSIAPSPARVDVALRGGGRVTANVPWAPLSVAGRVTPADLSAAQPPFRASTELPPATYRAAPASIAWLLDGAAAILAACGGALAAAVLLGARRTRPGETPDALARALRLARDARTRPDPDRRAAAGHVARLLARRDPPLARAAEDLAWSRPSPTPDSLTTLVEDVERELPS